MKLGYTFQNDKLLKKALTHISLANERGIESNQRLEFLGDSILSFVVAGYIYNRFTDMDEGRLTEMRAAAVCEKSLAAAARVMDLGERAYSSENPKPYAAERTRTPFWRTPLRPCWAPSI